MADELGAVLEAPEVIADDVVDQGLDLPNEPTDVAADLKTPEVEVKGDERVMPQWLRALKTTDPATFRTEKAKFFTERAILESAKDFDVKGTRSWLEEKGGREAVEATFTELQGKAAELDGISQKMQAGDPSLISDLIESSPEGFAKLAPVMAEQWAKADPEGWGAAMSGVMAATIAQNGIPMFLERMGMMFELGKTDQIPGMLKQLQEWAGSFQTKATAPRTNATVQPDKKFTEREQALNDREQKAFESEVEKEVESSRSAQITKELDTFFKRRPNDTDAKDLAINTVRNQVLQRLHADDGFTKSVRALLARKDKAGAAKLIKSREAAAITEIAPKVGRTIFGNPGAAAVTPGAKPAGSGAAPEAGYSLVEKAPDPRLIDRVKTTDAMIMRGKFILKDGRKQALEA